MSFLDITSLDRPVLEAAFFSNIEHFFFCSKSQKLYRRTDHGIPFSVTGRGSNLDVSLKQVSNHL